MKGESRKTSLLGINECQDSTKFHQYSCLNSCSLIIFKKTTDQHGINASVAGEFKQRATGRYPPPLLNSAGLCSVCILHPRGWLRLLVSTVLTQPGGGDGVGRRAQGPALAQHFSHRRGPTDVRLYSQSVENHSIY